MSPLSRRSFISGSLAWTTVLLAGCGSAAAPASPSTAPSPAAGSAAAKPSAGAPGSAQPAASTAASPKPASPGSANLVKAAWVAITANQMIWPLAVEAGYFDKYGVNFNLQYVQGSVTSVQALMAGDLQMVQVAGSAVVAAQAAKQDLVMTLGMLNQTVWRIMAPASITTVDQLKGRTVAVTQVGNADYFAWSALAQKQGWNVNSDFKFVNAKDAPGQVAVVQSGNAQAAAFSPPNDVLAQEKAGAHLVLDEAQYNLPEQQTGMALPKAYLAKNHDIALAVAKASVEAIHRWKTDEAFAKNVIQKYLKSDDHAYIDGGYSAYAQLFPEVPYPTRDGFAAVIQEVGEQTPSAKSVTPDQCLDNSLVQELESSGFIKQIFGASAGATSGAASAKPAASAQPATSGAASAKPAASASLGASGASSAKPAASA